MFCEANSVDVDDDDACLILDGRGMERSSVKQHSLVNVRFKAFHAGDRAKLSWRWYLIEAVTVVAHCCCLLLPRFSPLPTLSQPCSMYTARQ